MRNKGKKSIIIVAVMLSAVILTGCGSKKEADAESTQVIQISVAPPSVTPTPEPDQVDSSAVSTNGNLTMVNEYLADQGNSGTSDSSVDTGTDGNAESNTESNADNNAADNNTDGNDAGTGESDGSEEQ